jgi:DNA-binding IclR family transcriptional regulator
MSGSLSLERGLSVLKALKDSDEPLGVREIARRLELSAPAIQRLLNTLADHGYVEQAEDTRRYRIGHGVLVLAQHVLRKDRLIGIAEPELQTLASENSFNAFLGVRRNAVALYLLAIQSRSPVVIRSSPGETMALHSTALGKALLTGLSDESIGDVLGEAPLDKLTPRTVTDPGQLISQIQAARPIGYTTSLDENILGCHFGRSAGARCHRQGDRSNQCRLSALGRPAARNCRSRRKSIGCRSPDFNRTGFRRRQCARRKGSSSCCLAAPSSTKNVFTS